MQTSALPARQLWKLKGGGAVVRRLLARQFSRLYAVRIDNVYTFTEVTSRPRSFEDFGVQFREVPQDDDLSWDAEIAPDPELTATRFRSGARRYAAIWDGRGIELCWAVGNRDYYDSLDRFTLRLGYKDVYLFDYRGIRRKRPAAFGGFRLWVTFFHAIIDFENRRAGGGARFYTLVSTGNRVSNAFHRRKLNTEPLGELRSRVIFGRPFPQYSTDTPAIFVRP